MQLGLHLGCNLTPDVKLHSNFSGNVTRTSVQLRSSFRGISSNFSSVSSELKWDFIEMLCSGRIRSGRT
jgi:hypothetical protein